MIKKIFRSVDSVLRIRKSKGYGVSIAVAKGDDVTTYCSGSGRYGQDFPVNPDMLFQAGSVSKSVFALTLLRYVDKGIVDLDADISGVLSDFVDSPLTFSALLSHTAGFNVHGFPGYSPKQKPLSLEDVLSGRGNTPRIKQTMPYGKQYCYSGGGTTLAQLAFTRITGMTLQDAYVQEVATPLGLTRSGYFQPLDAEHCKNAAYGGKLRCGYHNYPEHAAAGFWTTPTELSKIGIALCKSVREGGLLKRETALRMVTPVLDDYGLCLFDFGDASSGHSGWNAGFLTYWRFSLTEDICVACMINNEKPGSSEKLRKIRNKLYMAAKD